MPTLDEKTFAEDYGFALSFLKSDSELYNVFKQAVAGTWTPAKFVAAVKNTKWYQTHGANYRTSLALEKSDPATFNEKVAQKFAEIADLSKSLGSTGYSKTITQLARNAVMFGWGDSQVRDALASYIRITNGKGIGQAGDIAQQLRQTAWRNGVRISDSFIQTYAQQIAAGNLTVNDAQRQLREKYGVAVAPEFAKQLAGGMDLYDLASPYIQSMATTLEMNPADIDLFDPTIRSALASTGPDGKTTRKTLYEFEQQLREDPRYMKTKGAQDSVMSIGKKVLQDFGFQAV